jgi:hypothetical protein
MQNDSEIKKVLQKFVQNKCSAQEIEVVIAYCKKKDLTDDFPTVEEVNTLLESLPKMDKQTADIIFAKIIEQEQPKISKPTNKVRKLKITKFVAIAASLLILVSIGFFYKNVLLNNPSKLPIPKEESITLQLENGKVEVLTEMKALQLKDEKGNLIGEKSGNEIVYNENSSLEHLEYNTINIPYGKKFKLQLSDGTVVHLNAGTSLKYPVKFIAGQQRKVFLKGEAFFDVTRDEKHPFIVNADALDIRVLGTHFNVSNYPEDAETDVVLVEGSVGLYENSSEFDATTNTILEAGFKGSFNRVTNIIATEQVDTNMYTAWVKGELIFRNLAFNSIIKKLERNYNIPIENNNKDISNDLFNASFKNESIERILSYFDDVLGLEYTIEDNKIIIN